MVVVHVDFIPTKVLGVMLFNPQFCPGVIHDAVLIDKGDVAVTSSDYDIRASRSICICGKIENDNRARSTVANKRQAFVSIHLCVVDIPGQRG
eukprot:CAMPEP_0185797422 /NCGR_PEP_ID=MMETSP1174-20130828/161608_1 /TAXON_ID=35687 /ORGANISM="Dictyocha speculum, Strain CCMP1381" /LENGTH=92 /DNA_ID=CAMNT_0028492855 /DNA_START=524 /DNA_END=802 /DNA_ORIENTATION=+